MSSASNSALAVVEDVGLGEPVVLGQEAREYAKAARSEATRRAYAWQWRRYCAWAEAQRRVVFAPETVADYLGASANAGLRASSLSQGLAAICEAFKLAGYPSPRSHPVVTEVWKGIRRSLGIAPRRAAPVLSDDLRRILRELPVTRRGLRDRALLSVGFAGAFRRSELVALDVGDLAFTDDGLVVTLRRSKSDQLGASTTVGIPFGSTPDVCPVRAVKAWLGDAGIGEGAVFRAVKRYGQVAARMRSADVALAVKRAVRSVGLDPSKFSGHSLRAGLATSAARAGKTERSLMRQGRWRSRAMIDVYVRDASLFTDNAAAGLL